MDLYECVRLVGDLATDEGFTQVEEPSADEVDAILEFARAVAHSSERKATPVVAFVLGRALATADSEIRIAFLRDATARLDGGGQAS